MIKNKLKKDNKLRTNNKKTQVNMGNPWSRLWY
jgi:hypothetical protein